MVREGSIAASPDDLQRWIARAPEVEASLKAGGYGTEFTAADLFPLLQVFVAQAGGPPAVEDAPARSFRWWWLGVGVLLVFLVVLLALALVRGSVA